MSSIYKTANGARIIQDKFQAFLNHWPVPFERVVVPTCEGDTSVIVCGDKQLPPLILFHGSMSNSIMWARDVREWSRCFRIYAVDIIGEPGMSAPSRPDLHSDAYAKWLDDVLAHFKIVQTAMVGISLGAWLALDFAIRRPGRVSQLVVMCPAAVGRQKSSFYIKAFLLLLLGKWGQRKLRLMVSGRQQQPMSEGYKSYLDYLSLVQKHFRPRIVRFIPFTDEMLKSLSMPVLAVLGAKDVFFDSVETRERLEQCVADVTVDYDEERGHMITGQTENILQFLRNKTELKLATESVRSSSGSPPDCEAGISSQS